jgi:hypothetical protein
MPAHLLLALALSAPPLSSQAGPPAPADPDPPREVLRALALAAAGDPDVARVQAAAARHAAALPEQASPLAALLPRITAEVRHAQESNRVVGLQGSGEVDYLRLSPGTTVAVRATWDLGRLAPPAPPGALEAARRRGEAAGRATRGYFERRSLRARLLLSPPPDPAARAAAELEVDRLGAELDALTGGLFRGGR